MPRIVANCIAGARVVEVCLEVQVSSVLKRRSVPVSARVSEASQDPSMHACSSGGPFIRSMKKYSNQRVLHLFATRGRSAQVVCACRAMLLSAILRCERRAPLLPVWPIVDDCAMTTSNLSGRAESACTGWIFRGDMERCASAFQALDRARVVANRILWASLLPAPEQIVGSRDVPQIQLQCRTGDLGAERERAVALECTARDPVDDLPLL